MMLRTGWGKWMGGIALLLAALAVMYVYFFTPWWPRLAAADGAWYGNWGAVLASVGFYTLFIIAFLRPPRRRDWRHLGISEAYIIALFTEMFGLPLTIYLLSSVFGVNLGLGGSEGHLWAVLLDRAGILPLDQGVMITMAVSLSLIAVGLCVTAYGWWLIWRAKGQLVTTGLYALVRHPQYSGFLLVIIAFLLQWPTVVTLLMFPVLVVTYVRLAQREDREMATTFGDTFDAYRERTPMLVPYLPLRTPAKYK